MDSSPEVGKKFDAGKAPLYMGVLAYFPRALDAVAQVSAYGVTKYKVSYGDKNWLDVPGAFARYSDALARHVTLSTYEEFDPESKLLHDAHAAWNALARLEIFLQTVDAAEETVEKEVKDEEVPVRHPVYFSPVSWNPRAG